MDPVDVDLAQWLQLTGFEARLGRCSHVRPASGLSDDRRSAH